MGFSLNDPDPCRQMWARCPHGDEWPVPVSDQIGGKKTTSGKQTEMSRFGRETLRGGVGSCPKLLEYIRVEEEEKAQSEPG